MSSTTKILAYLYINGLFVIFFSTETTESTIHYTYFLKRKQNGEKLPVTLFLFRLT